MLVRSALVPIVLLIASATARAQPTAARETNLLPNGGCEVFGSGGLPEGFAKCVYGAAPSIAADSSVFKEGRRSLRIAAAAPSDTAISQDLALRPGAPLRFSGWVRTQDLAPEERSWTHGTFQIQDSRGRAVARLTNHRGTTDWTEETAFFRVPADGKVRVACFFVGFGKGTGTAWFDGLRLEEVAAADAIVVTSRPLGRDPISPLLVGNFMELLSDLVPSMWAEQLDCTSFEYLRTPEERALRRSRFSFDPARDPQDRLWRPLGGDGAQCVLDPERPFNGAVSQRIRLLGGSEAGIAQDGIAVKQGETYRFVGHFRQEGLAGPVFVEIRDGARIVAQAAVGGVGRDWSRHEVTLRATATSTTAAFAVRIADPGTLWVDRVSLMPEKNVAGWRPDVIEAVRAMRPGVVRWGGSIIEGYSWRDGVGPWENRVPFANRYWGRIDPNFVGIDEFVAFCRAVDAEPLICLRWSGQKPEDAAELVEYVNGDAATRFGALRARNGHPKPHGVKLWQIGNEVGGPAYDASIADFARAMRRADPSIKVLASYISERILKDAGELIDYVSPHHYDCGNLEGTEADIERYVGLLERLAPSRPIRLAVTEWNTTAGGWGRERRHLWTLQNGLACARYLNLCHRYADWIKIACRSNFSNSYCSGIIQTNNHAVYGTPAYHVARLYADAAGSRPSALDNVPAFLEVDVSAASSADGRALSLFVVNYRDKPLTEKISVAALGRFEPRATFSTIADADDARDPEATNTFARPDRIALRTATAPIAGAEFSHVFPAYSVTRIELRRGR